jgi:hypothetical protein
MTTGEAIRGRWLRCPPCTELPHRPERCLGRDAGCCCRWCPGRWREIIADARRYRADPMVAELLRVIEWREVRRGKARDYRRWQPCCSRPGCGNRWATRRSAGRACTARMPAGKPCTGHGSGHSATRCGARS